MGRKKFFRYWLPFSLVLLFILAWTVLLFKYTPEEIVERLGLSNSYIVTFLLSMISAFTSVTTFSAYPAIVTLALGEMDPLSLGLVAGAGIAIGDILFFYFGYTVRGITTEKFKKKLTRVLEKVKKRSDLLIQFIIYIYVAFTPFPNNLLTGSLALIGYPFKKVVVPLVLGDITLPVVVAYIVYSGFDSILQKIGF